MMKKIYLPLLALVIGSQIPIRGYQSSWSGMEYDDQYAGTMWNMTWSAETGLVESQVANQAAIWMKDLPDNMFVAHVSIPGAHDFATGEAWADALGEGQSTTQAVTMQEQMDRGIRGLDLRPGLYHSDLWCNHGITRTEKRISDVLMWIQQFVTMHPSEFFVIHLFRGNVARAGDKVSGASNSASDRKTYNELMQKLFNGGTYKAPDGSDLMINWRPNLTVKEARGHIVVFLRDRIDFVHVDGQARLGDWDKANNNPDVPCMATNENNDLLSTKVWVQDISSGSDLHTKIINFQKQFDRMQAMPKPKDSYDPDTKTLKGFNPEWCMNFTSMEYDCGKKGATIYGTNRYKYGAEGMNPVAIEYFGKNSGNGPVGIFFSDYVCRTQTKLNAYSDYITVRGDEVVYEVIKNNFYGENPPVVEYAIPEDVPEESLQSYPNPFAGKTYFLRHKATGYWVCGGANWGSHAALDKHGYPLTISVEATTGEVFIQIPSGKYFFRDKDGYNFVNGSEEEKDTYELLPGEQEGTIVLACDNRALALTAFAYGEPWSHPYYDNLPYWIDCDEYRPGDLNQEFEIVSLEERIAELENANPKRPYDATFFMPAYSMGDGWDVNSQWTIVNDTWVAGQSSSYQTQQICQNGAYWKLSNDGVTSGLGKRAIFSCTKTLTGLPAGKYIVDFQAVGHGSANTKFKIGDLAAESIPQYNDELNGVDDENKDQFGANDIVGNLLKSGAGYVERTVEVGADGTLTIKFFNEDGNQSATSSYVDNIHLTYYGPTDATEDEITITFPEHWNTVILPFDVEDVDAVPHFGELAFFSVHPDKGYEEYSKVLAENDGEEYFYHVVARTDAIKSLKANTPYIVENNSVEELEPSYDTVGPEQQYFGMRKAGEATATYYATFKGFPTNYASSYTDADNFLTGVLSDDYTVGSGDYTLMTSTHYQLFCRIEDDETSEDVEKYRAYVHSDAETTAHPIILFKDIDNPLTGVEDVASDAPEGISDETPVDVYSIGGVLVRHQTAKRDALNELPRGIYILTDGATALKVVK